MNKPLFGSCSSIFLRYASRHPGPYTNTFQVDGARGSCSRRLLSVCRVPLRGRRGDKERREEGGRAERRDEWETEDTTNKERTKRQRENAHTMRIHRYDETTKRYTSSDQHLGRVTCQSVTDSVIVRPTWYQGGTKRCGTVVSSGDVIILFIGEGKEAGGREGRKGRVGREGRGMIFTGKGKRELYLPPFHRDHCNLIRSDWIGHIDRSIE